MRSFTVCSSMASDGATPRAGWSVRALSCGHGHKAHRVRAAQGKCTTVKHLQFMHSAFQRALINFLLCHANLPYICKIRHDLTAAPPNARSNEWQARSLQATALVHSDGLIAVRGSHNQVDRAWQSLTLRGLASCTMLCLRLDRGPSTRQRISLKWSSRAFHSGCLLSTCTVTGLCTP